MSTSSVQHSSSTPATSSDQPAAVGKLGNTLVRKVPPHLDPAVQAAVMTQFIRSIGGDPSQVMQTCWHGVPQQSLADMTQRNPLPPEEESKIANLFSKGAPSSLPPNRNPG